MRSISLVIVILCASCASTHQPKLEGKWKLSLPAGFEHEVTIQDLGKSEFLMRPAGLNSSGVYTLKDDELVMSRPTDERLTEFVWRIKADGSLVLIAEPPARKTGARYLGATMTPMHPTGD